MLKKEILKHLIYNRHKKFTAMEIFDWGTQRDEPVSIKEIENALEEIIKILHELTELGFLKEYREKKVSKMPPRYQAEPGFLRKLIERIEI